ncbi:uncharacterized protein LOC109610806 [Ooceraea biroi]|uniref:uncharacterized protein LOC109610806 n=1 Tax=Ooceraea biroi TaxID=2015173 RepID=UPI000F09076F|nr:uncharacterized protein LOC109610806 [Ooceraea biroi]
MDEMEKFLRSSDLESYTEIFKRSNVLTLIAENKIGINQITETTADYILPLLIAPIGDQLRYKKAVEAYKANISVLTESELDNSSVCILIHQEDESFEHFDNQDKTTEHR